MNYRNSGDTGGDKNSVVGRAPIAFTGEGEGSDPCSIEERRRLIELARQAVREAVATGRSPSVNAEDFPPRLREPRGSFVTLTQQGALRGCIGNLRATEPLYASIISNARCAATRDYRFPPVHEEELDSIEFEISVLSEPKPLHFTSPEDLLAKLQPHRDGVVLEIGSATSTFLPQVWRQLPDKVQFLSALAKKAGCGPDDWRKPGTRVLVYRVEACNDSEVRQ